MRSKEILFSLWWWLSPGRGCPGRLWTHHPWRYWKGNWTKPWATCCNCPCFGQGVGLETTRDPSQPLWFCEITFRCICNVYGIAWVCHSAIWLYFVCDCWHGEEMVLAEVRSLVQQLEVRSPVQWAANCSGDHPANMKCRAVCVHYSLAAVWGLIVMLQISVKRYAQAWVSLCV